MFSHVVGAHPLNLVSPMMSVVKLRDVHLNLSHRLEGRDMDLLPLIG